ncbi:helix-turn-helix domain-containing protein [Gordonia sp. ABSL1-1]|uniref:sigma-54-dependent Fis family transcriptional regulator n=1 Tax=Gordonia sp. ABSL1-1 TaxID=3053923 RepID=UPI002573FBEB|nr:helix-turn-helix domain-containing protein [Gordonia sp. ABSL1-1]MDL9936604.1 helix-turn-helix domain-containing protein [Gordonia sp. ABSL1-1]
MSGDRDSLEVAAARADFLRDEQRPGVRAVSDLVAASWIRSRSAGVDIERQSPHYSDEIDTSSRLVRCADPVLQQLGADISDVALIIALSDNRARMIKRVDLSTKVARMVDRVEFAPGYSYAEDTMGTNGVGTAIQSGQSISIVGPAHYSEQLQPFACTAAPIIDPITGRIEGILDVSTVAQSWSPLMHTLVKAAAKDIGRNLLDDRGQAQRILFNTYLHTDARATNRQAVFGFADAMCMANAAAQSLFSAEEQAAIRDHVGFVTTGRDRIADTLVLSSGRAVRLRGIRIVGGVQTAGTVVVAEPIVDAGATIDLAASSPEHRSPDPCSRYAARHTLRPGVRGSTSARLAAATSPTFRRACQQLRDALACGEPTLVFGEQGVGKFTLATELFGPELFGPELFGPELVGTEEHSASAGSSTLCIDTSLLGRPGGADLDELIPEGVDRPTLIVARGIDRLDETGSANLDQLIDRVESMSAPVVFAATATVSDGDDCRLPDELLSRFRASVTIPPLRYRTEDLVHVTNQLLGELAPRRHVRVSVAAQRILANYTWPGNIAELRAALIHALRSRPVGDIEVQDLPQHCQTSAKRSNLSPIQIAERDTIIRALQVCAGNRAAAAAQIGISRSGLYRKIRSYGITG